MDDIKNYGGVRVTLKQEYRLADYIIRNMCVSLQEEKKKSNNLIKSVTKRDITLYQFTAWPDRDVPSSPSELTSFLQFIKKEVEGNCESSLSCSASREPASSQSSCFPPVLVHCSSGIGRTGIFIALWNLLDEANARSSVDVFSAVQQLRQSRCMMVQTALEYKFLYENVAFALQPSLVPISVENIVDYVHQGLINQSLAALFRDLSITHSNILRQDSSRANRKECLSKNHPSLFSATAKAVPSQHSGDLANAAFMDSYTDKDGAIVAISPKTTDAIKELIEVVLDQGIKTVVSLDIDHQFEEQLLSSSSFRVKSKDMSGTNSNYNIHSMQIGRKKSDKLLAVTHYHF